MPINDKPINFESNNLFGWDVGAFPVTGIDGVSACMTKWKGLTKKMSLKKLTNNYVGFNSWANALYVDWLQTIDEQLLYRQVPSSFTSLDYTVQHILRVQKFWLAFVCQQDVSKFNWAVYEKQAPRILAELRLHSEEMNHLVCGFSEDQLCEKLKLDMPWAQNELSRYEYIMHAINHSTYHRGQLVTIARTIGISDNIPSTDYNFFNSKTHL